MPYYDKVIFKIVSYFGVVAELFSVLVLFNWAAYKFDWIGNHGNFAFVMGLMLAPIVIKGEHNRILKYMLGILYANRGLRMQEVIHKILMIKNIPKMMSIPHESTRKVNTEFFYNSMINVHLQNLIGFNRDDGCSVFARPK